MAKLFRYAGLLLKQEVTSGTDSVPTTGANAMLIRNVTWNPIQMTVEERDLVRPFLGNSEDIVMARWVEVDFEIELAGAGAAGDLPAYHDALLMAGHSHVVTASTDVTYTPVSSGFKSATAYFNLDQVLHKSLFMMAKLAIGLDALKIPVFKFSCKGLFVALADTTAWTPDYSQFVKPVGVNKANTTLSLHGVGAVVEKLQIDTAAQIEYRNLINFEGVQYTDRKPGGSISFEMTTVAAKNWLASIEAATTGALAVVHGTTAGNIVEFNAPAAQVSQPRYGNSQGIAMLEGNLKLMPGASGNDEYEIVVR